MIKHVLALLILVFLIVGAVHADPPKITMKVDPTEGIAPLTIRFSEDSGDPGIATWLWNFGNGDSFEKPSGEYIYDKPGEYELILSVWNEKGEVSTDKLLITVKEPEVTEIPTAVPTETIPPTVIIIYQGDTPISQSLTSKSAADKSTILMTATDTAMKQEKFPLAITSDVVINKYRCDDTMQICGYWISCTRNGKEVATNSPIWISPPPYLAIVSDVPDTRANTETITVKEDPKTAAETALRDYCDRRPLGKAIIGTKE